MLKHLFNNQKLILLSWIISIGLIGIGISRTEHCLDYQKQQKSAHNLRILKYYWQLAFDILSLLRSIVIKLYLV